MRKNIYATLLALTLNLYCHSQVSKTRTINFDRAFSSFANAQPNIKEGDTIAAINDYVKAAEFGYEPRQAYSNAIYFSILMGDLNRAMRLSLDLVGVGFRDLAQAESPPFNELEEHPDWSILRDRIIANQDAYERTQGDVANIKIITSDVDNFWSAYDDAGKTTDLDRKRHIYLHDYFNKGSVGLRDFVFLKMPGGIDQFVEFVEAHRPYYDGIRVATYHAVQSLEDYPSLLRKAERLIPDATFPDTYFLMGCHTSFGTVSINGSLIGLENVIDETSPISTLPVARQSVVKKVEFLPFVLIHELMHTYQNTSHRQLLGATIMEGGADFLAELIVGPPKGALDYRVFGRAHENDIWKEFSKNLDSQDHTNWISRVDSTKQKAGWPRDLSYFIGYKIAKGYYDKSTNKEQAILDLLEIKDPHKILKESGYMQ